MHYLRISLISLILAIPISQDSIAETAAERYDFVLRNGRVVDPETNLDGLRDVGITGDRIAKIAEISSDPKANRLDGAVVYDVRGMVVAPGFIDMHVHGMTIPLLRMRAFDGVTTALELENGVLPVDEGYELVERLGGSPVNYGFSAAWTMARMAVMDGVDIDGNGQTFADNFGGCCWSEKAGLEYSNQTTELLEVCGILQGSIGIGMNLGYAPKSNTEEFEMLSRLAKRYDTLVSVHLRYSASCEPGDFEDCEPCDPRREKSNMDALNEAIQIVENTGAHMYINHISSTMNWRIEEGIERIEKAMEDLKGRDGRISTETLLYGAASTVIGTPATTREQLEGRRMTFANVYHVGERRFMESQNELDRYRETRPGDLIIMHFLPEDDPCAKKHLDEAVLFEHATMASDSLPLQFGNTPLLSRDWPVPSDAFAHPRSMGTYGKLLRHYVREENKISLMEAIRRSSLLPAQILEAAAPAMKNKGRLQEGRDADIIVFDPEKVEDRANYDRSIATGGMMYVFVNGAPVVREYQLDTFSMPGRAIRGEPGLGSVEDSNRSCSELIEKYVGREPGCSRIRQPACAGCAHPDS